MTKFKLLGIAAVLSAAVVSPALAQFAQQEPAAYASIYPNGDPSARSGAAMASVPGGRPATVIKRQARASNKNYARDMQR